MEKTLILDRDGILNVDKGYLSSLEDVDLLFNDKLVDFINNTFDYVYIVTNQSGVGRGLITLADLSKINSYIIDQIKLKVTDIVYCPHLPSDNCLCRKPKSGMIIDIVKRHKKNNTEFYIVGDKWSDILSGVSFVKWSYYLFNPKYVPGELTSAIRPVTMLYNHNQLYEALRRDFAGKNI